MIIFHCPICSKKLSNKEYHFHDDIYFYRYYIYSLSIGNKTYEIHIQYDNLINSLLLQGFINCFKFCEFPIPENVELFKSIFNALKENRIEKVLNHLKLLM